MGSIPAREPPDIVVQRQDFRHYQTYDGDHFTPSEIAWFERNYELAREFKFAWTAWFTGIPGSTGI